MQVSPASMGIGMGAMGGGDFPTAIIEGPPGSPGDPGFYLLGIHHKVKRIMLFVTGIHFKNIILPRHIDNIYLCSSKDNLVDPERMANPDDLVLPVSLVNGGKEAKKVCQESQE